MNHSDWIPKTWKELAKKTQWSAAKWQQRMVGNVQFGIARWEVDVQLAGVDGAYHGKTYDTAREACDDLDTLMEELSECLEGLGNNHNKEG